MSTPIGAMIRDARLRTGKTLDDVATQVGVTPGALSHIESGRRLPYPQNAARIAEVLGLSAEEVMVALDEAHADRRRMTAFEAPAASPASPAPRAPRGFRAQPIDALFGRDRQEYAERSASPTPMIHDPAYMSPRQSARWSDDTAERLTALDRMADSAAETIRTLRGLIDDDDPVIAREARRLLRELDVRLPEE